MSAPSEPALEERLAALMAEHADVRLGAERPAPAFDPTDRTDTTMAATEAPSRRRRYIPLLAAAVVLVLALGLFLLATHTRQADPAEPTPDGRQEVLGARIAVPDGWVLRQGSSFATTYYFATAEHTYCVTPRALASDPDWKTCPVWIGSFDDSELAAFNLPEATFPLFGDIDICPELKAYPRPKVATGLRQFGGREAEWRRFVYPCSATRSDYFENYVVETGPNFMMSTMQDSAAAREAMTYIAAHSELPTQTTELRYHDQGVVTAIRRAVNTTAITLDRVYGVESLGFVVRSKVSVTYAVKTAVVKEALQGAAVKVGDRLLIDTDGRAVTWLEVGPLSGLTTLV